MQAKELIKQLQELPSDTEIVVRGYEGGVNPVSHIASVQVIDTHEGANLWIFGRYEVDSTWGRVLGDCNAVQIIGDYNLKTELG